MNFYFGAGDIAAVMNQLIPGETRRLDKINQTRVEDESDKKSISRRQFDSQVLKDLETRSLSTNRDDFGQFVRGSKSRAKAVSNVRAAQSSAISVDRVSTASVNASAIE